MESTDSRWVSMLRTQEAVQYAVEELWRRTGFPENLKRHIKILYTDSCPEPSSIPQVWIRRASDRDISSVAFGGTTSLVWLSPGAVFPEVNPDWPDPIPVLFWGEGEQDRSRFATVDSQHRLVKVHADIIAAVLYMLTRWEEVVRQERDEHGRFPANSSAAVRLGFLDRPVVDEYAIILREWLKVLLPRVSVQASGFRVRLTHDIDSITAVPRGFSGLKRLAGAIAKRRSVAEATMVARGMVSGVRSDVYYRRIFDVLEIDRRQGFNEVVAYLMAAPKGRFDSGYAPDSPEMKKVFRLMDAYGVQVGLHPGYEAFGHPKVIKEQRERLERALGCRVWRARQHFLRFSVPQTWRDLVEAGLEEDSTVGYADHEGFRCGTAHPFQAFDVERNEVLPIREYPLIVMDGTLRQYRRLSHVEAIQVVRKLARATKRVGGTFVFLWHNSSFDFEWDGWGRVYEASLEELTRL